MKFARLLCLIPMRQGDALNHAPVGAHGCAPLRMILLLAILLAACAPASGGDPAQAVEQYLTAKVAGDETALRPLLCSAMEADLSREASSFAAVDAHLTDMSCTRAGDTDIVDCTGKIDATYGTEQTSFPLTSYRVVQVDGEWKWCGEAP